MNQHDQERHLRGDTSWPADHGCDGRGVPGEVQGYGPGRIIPDCRPIRLCMAHGGGQFGLYLCTLPPGHAGSHAALGPDGDAIAEWANG